MSELRVRDHSQLCRHGFMFSHTIKKGEVVQVGQLPAVCPGGKEIVLQSTSGEHWGGFCKRGPARSDKLRWYWEFFVYEPHTHAVCGDERVEVVEE